MNRNLKQRISGTVYLISVLIMVFSIAHMIPYGLAGNSAKVKTYFTFGAVSFIVGCPFGVAYYYNQKASNRDSELERMKIESDALSYMGQPKPHPLQKIDNINPSDKLPGS